MEDDGESYIHCIIMLDQPLSSDEDSEGMFELDEDMVSEEKQGDEKGKGKSTPTWSKRRSSTKYISGFEGEDNIHIEQEGDDQGKKKKGCCQCND